MNIEELIPHKRNSEFFDDMTGEKWQEFLESIKTSGVIEPIVITQDKVIVSGHQRVRACKELGITEILAETKHYKSEDDVIKDLLETNIRQRGDVGGSDLKLGRRIRELERIYGVRNGSANPKGTEIGVSSSNGTSRGMTQQDLANQFGIDINTLKRAKSLTTLPSEIQDLIEQGNISPSTASRLIAKLTPEQQEQLIQSLPVTEKLTQKQVQKYVEQLKTKQDSVDLLKRKYVELQEQLKQATNDNQKQSELENQIERLKKRIVDLTVEKDSIERQKTKTVVERVEVDKPETLQEIQDLRNQLQKKTEDNRTLSDMNTEQAQMLSHFMGTNTEYQLVSHCSEITLKMLNFVKDMAQYDYMAECFNEIPEATRQEYVRCITSVKKWAENILNVIATKENVYVVNVE